jgi:hypothetical protein
MVGFQPVTWSIVKRAQESAIKGGRAAQCRDITALCSTDTEQPDAESNHASAMSIILAGVAGAGKSIARELMAKELGWRFYERIRDAFLDDRAVMR